MKVRTRGVDNSNRMQARIACIAIMALPSMAAVDAEEPAAVAAVPRLPIKVFAQLERMRSAEISPDGKHVASISSLGGRPTLTIRPLPIGSGNTSVYPPFDPNFDYNWAHWASDSRVLVGVIGSVDRGYQGMFYWNAGTETRLLSAAADGSSIFNAIRPRKEISTGSNIARQGANITAPVQDRVIDWLPNEPDHVLVSIADDPTRGRGDAVRKVDITNGDYTYVKSATKGVYLWKTDRSGELRLGFAALRQDKVNRWLVYRNPNSNEWEEYPDSPLVTGKVAFAGFDTDPHYGFVIRPDAKERRALMRWNIASGQPEATVFSDPDSEVDSVIYAPDRSGEIIGVRLQDDHTVYLDPQWKRRMASLGAALPGMHVGITSATKDKSQFMVIATSATDPGTYYLYDAEKHRLAALAYVRADVEPEQMGPVKRIVYHARDGMAISAILTTPRGVPARNLPAILLPHGGPAAHDSLEFDWLAQFLANRGYAVLQPNFRGSTGFGLALQRAGDRQWGRAMQDDITDGAQWLVQEGIADPKRLAIVGGSYGGYAALMGAVKTPELFRCAVSLNGVSDVINLLTSDTGNFKDEAVARTIGDPSADHDMLAEVSPLRHVDRIRIPVLLVHAKDDLRVDFSQSRNMYDALLKAGKPAEFVALSNGQHWLLTQAARAQFLAAIEAFLAKNL